MRSSGWPGGGAYASHGCGGCIASGGAQGRYSQSRFDRIRNYLIGHAKLGFDRRPILAQFSEFMPASDVIALTKEALDVTWIRN